MSTSLPGSSVKPSSASLNGLPAELLSGIAELLSARHIGNLRRTSREMRDKTMFVFCTYHFESISVEVLPGGFRRLEEICKRDQFRPYVRQVYIRANYLVNRKYVNIPRGSNLVGFYPEVLDFIHSGRFAHVVRRCFARLENLQHVWVGQPYIPGDLIPRGVGEFRREWSTIVETALSGICEHQIQLRALEVCSPHIIECPPDISCLETIFMTPALFDLITKLRLELRVAEDKPSHSQIPGLLRGLERMKGLESLSLSFDGSIRSGKVLAEASQHIGTFPALRKLLISRVSCSSDVLMGFIGMARATVRDLSVLDVTLDPGGAKNLLTFLLNELSLVFLGLDALHEGTRVVSFRPIHSERPIIDEHWYEGLSPVPSEEEREVLRSYHYITLDWAQMDTHLNLREKDGDDIRQWLSVTSDKYELVDHQPLTFVF